MKVKCLDVITAQGVAGKLNHGSRYVFNYETKSRDCEISLTMPLRAESYASGALPPIFSMNRPEGWLQQKIVERMSKHEHVDDMRLLSIIGHNQIGRLRYINPADSESPATPKIGLEYLLNYEDSQEIFSFLTDQYLASGISGVQPKVMMPDADQLTPDRATMATADLIVKSSGVEYPNLAVNEFLCMEAARRAGICVPQFWLSKDNGLFVMARFDLVGDSRLGFEDMAVLMGKTADMTGRYKYDGSYEGVAKAIGLFCHNDEAIHSAARLFEYVALSVMVRNGDAHLKNFGLIYDHPAANKSPTLAPMYDVVTTSVYDDVDRRTGRIISDRTLALKLRKSNQYPLREALIQFGAGDCHVLKPESVLDRIATAMSETLVAHADLTNKEFMCKLTQQWDEGRSSLEPTRVFAPTSAPKSFPENPNMNCAP